jgi:hypothetical protein
MSICCCGLQLVPLCCYFLVGFSGNLWISLLRWLEISLTVTSFLLMVSVTLCTESIIIFPFVIFDLFILQMFKFFLIRQSLVAFRVLSLVSPLTYSIANTCKRIFVIVSSILYFGNKVTPMNAIGIFFLLSFTVSLSQISQSLN